MYLSLDCTSLGTIYAGSQRTSLADRQKVNKISDSSNKHPGPYLQGVPNPEPSNSASSGQEWRLNASVYAYMLSHVRLSATPWTAAHQASLSMEFSRQE